MKYFIVYYHIIGLVLGAIFGLKIWALLFVAQAAIALFASLFIHEATIEATEIE